MGYQFRFNNELNEDKSRGLESKISYIKGAYQVPDFIDKKVAVDIGCNLGGFPISYHDIFDKIYAFEASYECFEQSFLNIQERKIRNTFLFNLAAYHTDGKLIPIRQHENHDNGSNSIMDHPDWNTGVYHLVPTISLDGIFNLCNIDRINCLKADCEGAEYELLIDNPLVSRIDFITAEFHIQRPEKCDELLEFLKQYFVVLDSYHPRGCHPMYQLVNKKL